MFSFFKQLDNMSMENKIFEEIQTFKSQVANKAYLSLLNSSLLRLYNREITAFKFLKKINKIKGLIRVGIRYLAVFLLFFPELGLISNSNRSTLLDSQDSILSLGRERNGVKIRPTLEESDLSKTLVCQQQESSDEVEKVAKFLTDAFEETLQMGDQSEKYDKQFLFYALKISDWMTYKSDAKVTMMGETVTDFALLEKMRFSKSTKKMLEKIEFWSTYYRQNNYFYEMNQNLLQQQSSQREMKGIEKKLYKMEPSSSRMEEDSGISFGVQQDSDELSINTFLTGESVLSRWGIRSSSLNDIIRYLIYMRVNFDLINSICAEITMTYSVDKKIAYQVFKETEDEFTIRGYLDSAHVGGSGSPDDLKFGIDFMRNENDLARLDALTDEQKDQPQYLERDKDLEILVRIELDDLSNNRRDSKLCNTLKICLHFLSPTDARELLMLNKTFLRHLQIPFTKWMLVSFDFQDQADRVAAWWTLIPEVQAILQI